MTSFKMIFWEELQILLSMACDELISVVDNLRREKTLQSIVQAVEKI